MPRVAGSPVPGRRPPTLEAHTQGDWTFHTVKSHILTAEDSAEVEAQLAPLPHLPDMLFLHNRLKVSHSSGATLEYSPLEALRRVNAEEELVTVSYAQDWLASRQDSPHLNKVVKPYDWTYTTDYKGDLSPHWRVLPSSLTIDYTRLKVQEKILFFDEVVLYEDELDDNGCAKLSLKIRAMPSGFFILLRFYLRVDKTLIRVHDTRLRYEEGEKFILREYSERQQKVEELRVGREVWTDQNAIVDHLPITLTQTDQLLLPEVQ